MTFVRHSISATSRRMSATEEIAASVFAMSASRRLPAVLPGVQTEGTGRLRSGGEKISAPYPQPNAWVRLATRSFSHFLGITLVFASITGCTHFVIRPTPTGARTYPDAPPVFAGTLDEMKHSAQEACLQYFDRIEPTADTVEAASSANGVEVARIVMSFEQIRDGRICVAVVYRGPGTVSERAKIVDEVLQAMAK